MNIVQFEFVHAIVDQYIYSRYNETGTLVLLVQSRTLFLESRSVQQYQGSKGFLNIPRVHLIVVRGKAIIILPPRRGGEPPEKIQHLVLEGTKASSANLSEVVLLFIDSPNPRAGSAVVKLVLFHFILALF